MQNIIGLTTPLRVNIQVKLSPQRIGENNSRSMTVYGMNVDEAFNRIRFMFDTLSKTDDDVVIRHYKLESKEG